MKRLLTVAELAELVQVAPATIYQWAWLRRIPIVKIGRSLRFDAEVIEQWIAQGGKSPVEMAPVGHVAYNNGKTVPPNEYNDA
jgi:excisionase family DNA binding protein